MIDSRVIRSKLTRKISSIGSMFKSMLRASCIALIATLALISFNPALQAEELGQPLQGHLTLLI